MMRTVSPGCARFAAVWIVAKGCASVPGLEFAPDDVETYHVESNMRSSSISMAARAARATDEDRRRVKKETSDKRREISNNTNPSRGKKIWDTQPIPESIMRHVRRYAYPANNALPPGSVERRWIVKKLRLGPAAFGWKRWPFNSRARSHPNRADHFCL